jgi:hypothetical protein
MPKKLRPAVDLMAFRCRTLKVKEGLLACKKFDFLKTNKGGCKLDAINFTSMATGHNRFSVVAEHSSHAFCKIAPPLSPRRRYPELPDLSDNPLPSYMLENTKYHQTKNGIKSVIRY